MVQPHPQLGGGARGVVITNQEMQSKSLVLSTPAANQVKINSLDSEKQWRPLPGE